MAQDTNALDGSRGAWDLLIRGASVYDGTGAAPRAVDVAIRGEPEATFEELIRTLEAGEPIADILGLMWRDGDAVRMAEPRPFIKDLDDLPFAARDLLPNHRYTLPTNGHRFTLVNVARGCPYPCIFCIAPVYYGRPLRRH